MVLRTKLGVTQMLLNLPDTLGKLVVPRKEQKPLRQHTGQPEVSKTDYYMRYIHRISRYRMRASSHHSGPFLQKCCPYKSAILDLFTLFKANYPVIFAQIIQQQKYYLLSFLVKKTSSCQFQYKKRFCFSNKKSSGEFSCPYRSAILWRHIFYWHEIGARILDLSQLRQVAKNATPRSSVRIERMEYLENLKNLKYVEYSENVENVEYAEHAENWVKSLSFPW